VEENHRLNDRCLDSKKTKSYHVLVPFTFECGVCHAVYRLDEQQITAVGVKITCPKCLNYFFLKRGGTEAAASPVVEYVVPDGAYDVSEKTEKIPAAKSAVARPTSAPAQPKAPPPPPPPKAPPAQPFGGSQEKTWITADELSDLPPDPPPSTAADQYIMLGSGIIIVAVTLLYLNFSGIISIPGLERFKKKDEVTAPVPTESTAPTDQKVQKYGFPKMDGYNGWTGKEDAATPGAPSPQAPEAQDPKE
jgi:predicted Zn finger-like uncharacterized protein